MLVGVNVQPYGQDDPDELQRLGVQIVRFVLKPEHEFNPEPYFMALKDRGIGVLGVIASESLEDLKNAYAIYEDVGWYCWRYGSYLDALQLGNEPDGVGESSWMMSPEEYAWFLKIALSGVDAAGYAGWLIGAGLCSGNADYWREVVRCAGPDTMTRISTIAIHPYGIKPTASFPPYDWGFGVLEYLLQSYQVFGKWIAITEFGCTTEQESYAFQGMYLPRMLNQFASYHDIPMANWFTHSDLAVAGYGLREGNGEIKPAWSAMRHWIKAHAQQRREHA